MAAERRFPLVWAAILFLVLIGVIAACALAVAGMVVFGSQQVFQTHEQPAAPPPAVSPPQPPLQVQPASGELSESPGFPGVADDIPIPAGVETSAFVGIPHEFSFVTDQNYDDMLAFYQQQLAALGWEPVNEMAVIGTTGAELRYDKGERRLIVRIAGVPVVGTVVEIIEQR